MQIPSSRKNLYLIFVLVFAVKLVTIIYLSGLTFCQKPELQGGHWANLTGDSFSYIGAMENFITHGKYFFINEKGDIVRAGRMPYFAMPYFLFRQFLSPANALDWFVLFQLLIETAAIVCLALMVYDITKWKWSFYLSIIMSVSSLYVTTWSFTTISDGMCANVVLITAFFFYQYQHSHSTRDFKVFSILLALSICLRPYLVLVLPIVGLYELLTYKFDIMAHFKKMVLLALPLILLLFPWVLRNYLAFNTLIIFQQDVYAGYNYGKDELAIRKVLTALGEESSSYWDKKTAASYFYPKSVAGSVYQYPAYILADTDTYKKLEKLRILNLSNKRSPNLVEGEATDFLQFYRERYPIRYYFLNNVERVKKFLLHSGSYYLPINKTFKCYRPAQFVLKVFQSFLYYVYLVVGTIGLILLVNRNRNYLWFLFPTVFLIVLFPIVFQNIEWRFFLPFYHFHQIGVVFLCFVATKKIAVNRKFI